MKLHMIYYIIYLYNILYIHIVCVCVCVCGCVYARDMFLFHLMYICNLSRSLHNPIRISYTTTITSHP